MNTLLPLLLLAGITGGVFYFINSSSSDIQPVTITLQEANLAFQEQRFEDAYNSYLKASLQGKAEAQFKISQMLEHGQGTKQNHERAAHWMEKAASSGLTLAEYTYAGMLEFGRSSLTQSPKEALQWYKKAAEHNHPEATLKVAKLLLDHKDKLPEALKWSLNAQKFTTTKHGANKLSKLIIKKIQHGAQQNINGKLQYELASMYQNGIGVKQDASKSLYWLKQAAKHNHLLAQYELGKALSSNPFTHQKSLYWLTLAAKKGHREAGYAIAALLSQQKRTRGNAKEAWRWLYYGMRSANPKALYNLAVILHTQRLELPKNDDYFASWLTYSANNNITQAQNDIAVFNVLNHIKTKKNLAWLNEAASAGDIKSQFNLGLLLVKGIGTSPDYDKAVSWWKQASENGNIQAQHMIGLLYHTGIGIGRSEKSATQWYEKASTAGINDSTFNLAMIYYHGRGIEQNFEKAAALLENLANQSDTQAQNIYATLFLEGKGVARSLQTAVSWFKRAARAGNTRAMFNLATSYRSGNGIAQDDKKALFWYKKAAESDFAPAQNAIAYLYAEGRGTKKDLNQAKAWLYKASSNGLRIADSNLKILGRQGKFTLVTIQINDKARTEALSTTNQHLDDLLEVYHQPIF